MKKILLPLEQTDRSLKTLQYFRKHYSPEEASVVLLMVDEDIPYSATIEEEHAALAVVEEKLELIRSFLVGYEVITRAEVGKAGSRICKCAREFGVSLIAMTKSSKDEMLRQLGKTAEYVVLNAPCDVVIVSENHISNEYRGLVYSKAESVVNLRGQMGNKQSECLLPNASGVSNYHIDVTVGSVRFLHTSYNPETGNWDQPPAGDQEFSVEVYAGVPRDITVVYGKVEGKSDRIRIINQSMKNEAVFSYSITAADEATMSKYEAPAAEATAEASVAEAPIAPATEAPVAPVAEAVAEAPVAEAPIAPATDSTFGEQLEDPFAEGLTPEPVDDAFKPVIENKGDGFVRTPIEVDIMTPEEQAAEYEEYVKQEAAYAAAATLELTPEAPVAEPASDFTPETPVAPVAEPASDFVAETPAETPVEPVAEGPVPVIADYGDVEEHYEKLRQEFETTGGLTEEPISTESFDMMLQEYSPEALSIDNIAPPLDLSSNIPSQFDYQEYLSQVEAEPEIEEQEVTPAPEETTKPQEILFDWSDTLANADKL